MRPCIRISLTSCSTMLPRSSTCGRNSLNSTPGSRSPMFDSDLDRKNPADFRRRLFLAGVTATAAGLAFWQWRKPRILEAAGKTTGEPKEVTVVQFSDSGERLKKVRLAKVSKTAEEWRKQLPPGVFDITRKADTEIAFS